MKEYIIAAILTWLLKTLIDLGVKYSKRTENTIDDLIFNFLKQIFTSINLKKK